MRQAGLEKYCWFFKISLALLILVFVFSIIDLRDNDYWHLLGNWYFLAPASVFSSLLSIGHCPVSLWVLLWPCKFSVGVTCVTLHHPLPPSEGPASALAQAGALTPWRGRSCYAGDSSPLPPPPRVPPTLQTLSRKWFPAVFPPLNSAVSLWCFLNILYIFSYLDFFCVFVCVYIYILLLLL